MMNEEDIAFLKQLTVLYVEDDLDSRAEIVEIFKNYFCDVVEASDGQEALNIYKNYVDENRYIDIVISDINMPNINGIAFLEEMRNMSENIPFIFTTAHTDSPILLDAIKFKVTSYVLKPIDFVKLLEEVLACAKRRYKDKQHKEEKKQLNNHLSSIDQVAIVLKSNHEQKLTYANKAFYDISKYDKKEIVGKDYGAIIHPHVSDLVLRQMWEDARQKGSWNGKLKSMAKDETIFYVNTTLIPIYDDEEQDIIEYYHISFSITNYELEKRDFKKRVIENVQETRKQTNKANKIIGELKNELDKYKEMNHTYELEKKKNIEYLKQLKLYADRLTDIECYNEQDEVSSNVSIEESSENVENQAEISKD